MGETINDYAPSYMAFGDCTCEKNNEYIPQCVDKRGNSSKYKINVVPTVFIKKPYKQLTIFMELRCNSICKDKYKQFFIQNKTQKQVQLSRSKQVLRTSLSQTTYPISHCAENIFWCNKKQDNNNTYTQKHLLTSIGCFSGKYIKDRAIPHQASIPHRTSEEKVRIKHWKVPSNDE